MSHITHLKTKIKDLNFLKKACERLGVKLEGNVIEIPGKGKVYLERAGEFWDIIIPEPETLNCRIEEIEEDVGVILQTYSYLKIVDEVEKKGFKIVSEKLTEDGVIKLSVEV